MFAIGDSLREARVRQGLGYPEIERATKIRVKYIRALEEEDYSILPGDTYIRGFLRTYADYLGLDGQLYVDEFASRFGSSWSEDVPAARARRPGRDRGIERRAVLLALAGIAVLTLLVFAAWRFGGIDSSASTPSVVQTRERSAPAVAPELELRGVSSGTYVEVRRDSATGRIVLQGTIQHRGVERLRGSRFYLFVRHPAGLRVKLSGKAVSLPAHRNLRVLVTPKRTTRLAG